MWRGFFDLELALCKNKGKKSRKKYVNPRLEGNQYFRGRLTGFP
jgi:hypothetical protein